MLTINIIKTSKTKTISGTIGTDKFSCNYSDETLNQLKEKQEEFENIKEVADYEAWVAKVKEIVESKVVNPLEESAVKDIYFNSEKGTYHLKGKNTVSKIAIPELLVQKMFEAKDKGLSVIPLVKAWARFLRNPNFTEHKAYLFSKYITAEIIDTDMVDKLVEEEGYTVEAAISRSRFNEVTITNQGLIQTRKYVTLVTEGYEVNDKNEVVKVPLFKTTKTVDKISGKVTEVTDTPEFSEEFYFLPAVQGNGGDDFMCNGNLGHTLQVGHEVYLEKWSQVDTRDEVNCVKGLHSGGLSYVASYAGNNKNLLLDMFVDPAEIGAICDLEKGTDGAIRAKSYFVYGASIGKNKSMYHSSNYAELKDKEWEAYKEKAIKNIKADSETLTIESEDINNIE